MDIKKQVATVSNDLVLRSKYKLTATEQKLILYMVSLIQPDDVDFNTQLIPFSEIERIFNHKNAKWGNIYAYLKDVLRELKKKSIEFDTGIRKNGIALTGEISWVSATIPQYDENGRLCILFEFSKFLKPFFLELKKNFTKYQLQDIINMSSANAIRLYQILKTHKDRQSQYQDVAVISYTVEELKERMGLSDKKAYKLYGNFKNKVLKVAQQQLEKNTHIKFEFKEKKSGRKITGLVFTIYNNLPKAEEEELINLFNAEEVDTTKQTELEHFVFQKVKDWGISKDNAKRIAKGYTKAYIEEKINYTNKMDRLGKVRSSKASFFFGALKNDYKDEVVLRKKVKAVKKQQLLQKALSEKEAMKLHQKNMNALRISLFMLHTDALANAFDKTIKKGVLNYNQALSKEENYEKSRIFRAAVHNTLEETYPAHFEKEKKRNQEMLKALRKK